MRHHYMSCPHQMPKPAFRQVLGMVVILAFTGVEVLEEYDVAHV